MRDSHEMRIMDEEKQSYHSSRDEADMAEGEQPEQLHRKLKSRHMQMIAIGGSIGTGLFVGSGQALAQGGPASLVIDFILIGIMLFFTVHALGELAVMYPVSGAFYAYAVRFLDPAWGFAMGWNYAMSWLVVLPLELTAASITIQFWSESINIGIWIAIFLLSVVVVNFFGVRGYGEIEYVLGMIKVVAVVGFIILGIIIDVGGVPTDNRGYIGGRYWSDPGAFRNGFKGFCSVFVTAAFAFGGTELVGLAAAEADNPRRSLPKATKQVFWRIALFYIISLTLIGLIVPSDDKKLLSATGGATKYSPFVEAMRLAGIKGLPHVFNAVITLSVLSVANSCSYASTRTLHALAERGMAPRYLGYVDKAGRPLVALVIALLFGCLAFINEANVGNQVFAWLLSISGLSSFFTWGSICLAHIRFRYAWKKQGFSTDELPFKAALGVIGSYIGLGLNITCLVAQFYVALFPIDQPTTAVNFFQAYLAAPVIVIFYLGYKFYTRDWSFYVKSETMDLLAGRRELALGEILQQERKEQANWPWYKKAWNCFC